MTFHLFMSFIPVHRSRLWTLIVFCWSVGRCHRHYDQIQNKTVFFSSLSFGCCFCFVLGLPKKKQKIKMIIKRATAMTTTKEKLKTFRSDHIYWPSAQKHFTSIWNDIKRFKVYTRFKRPFHILRTALTLSQYFFIIASILSRLNDLLTFAVLNFFFLQFHFGGSDVPPYFV